MLIPPGVTSEKQFRVMIACRHTILVLSFSCTAGGLVLPGARRGAHVTACRARTPTLGLFDFLKKPTPEELIGEVANPASFSGEELTALKSASCSEDAPCRGKEKYQVIPDPPKALLTSTFMELPRSYYDIFRNRRGE